MNGLGPVLAVLLGLDGYGDRILTQIAPVGVVDGLVRTVVAQIIDDGLGGGVFLGAYDDAEVDHLGGCILWLEARDDCGTWTV